MKKGRRVAWVFLFFLPLLVVSTIRAEDLAPTYAESVRLAVDHARNPEGWRPSSLFVVSPAAPAPQGLTYDNGDPATGNLIVRSLSRSVNHYRYSDDYVGKADYRIYDPKRPQETAAWVTTGNDMTKFLDAHGATGGNVVRLMERALGMDTSGTHDVVVEFTVVPDNDHLMRPARNPDITEYTPDEYRDTAEPLKAPGMGDSTYENFKAYYNNFKASAYDVDNEKSRFPWTQLGYTFFWGNGYPLEKIQGLSEFIILGGTPVGIWGIYATTSYLYTRNDGTSFSDATGDQFGNGFASFRITGACETVWAGHRFQKKVRTTADNPNVIVVEKGAVVSGGEGILVWSLNYDVDNAGVISGATAAKFGLAGTADVAVLFKGDTTTSHGTPITAGVNRLVNRGTISSPGTAVKAEGGDTVVENRRGGVISGGEYAVKTGAGNDTVTLKGGEIDGRVDLGTGTDRFDVTGAEEGVRLGVTVGKETARTPRILVRDAGAGVVTIADGTTIAVTTAGKGPIVNGETFLVVDTDNLTVTPANLAVRNDDALPMVRFEAAKDGGRLYLVARRDGAYYGKNSGNASLGAVLDSLVGTAGGDMADVLGDLDRSGKPADARKLGPVANGAPLLASFGALAGHAEAVRGRIDQLRAGRGGVTGIATGDEEARRGAWVQGLASYQSRKAEGTTGAYDIRGAGASFGFDRRLFPSLLVGVSGGFARHRLATDDPETAADADSYQGGLYAALTRDSLRLDAAVSFAYNRYDSSRHIAFGTTNRVAKGRYDGRQYSLYLEGGRDFTARGFVITPLVSAHYMRLHLGEYTETGAGDLNLHVASEAYNLFRTGVGLKAAYSFTFHSLLVIPEVHGRVLHDAVGDRQRTTAAFTGGGASFVTEGPEPARTGINAGARLFLLTRGRLGVVLNYDYEGRAGLQGHSGYLNLRYAF